MSELLPFRTDETDLHEGIGSFHDIVEIANYDGENIFEGRCTRCGYDRADMRGHTEVEHISLRCRHCGIVLDP